jgi:hypothetical protein
MLLVVAVMGQLVHPVKHTVAGVEADARMVILRSPQVKLYQ